MSLTPAENLVDLVAQLSSKQADLQVQIDALAKPAARGSSGIAANPALSMLQCFRVKSVENDQIVCRTWDGSTEGSTDVYIAKPWKIRQTPFDGLEVNSITYVYSLSTARTASNTPAGGSDVETQVVTPEFVVDIDNIYGMYVRSGTAVFVGDVSVKWIDMNVDGRAWAKEAS